MKKSLIIIFLLNISLVWTANAQEPTKQETIDWIASKFKTLLGDNLEYKYLSNGIIYLENKEYELSYTIDLNKLRRYGYFHFYGTQGLICNKNTGRVGRSIECDTSFSLDSYIDILAEENLHERFGKAAAVLIKYNKAGSNEKF